MRSYIKQRRTNMIKRCHDKTYEKYDYYWWRWIFVCKKRHNFDCFYREFWFKLKKEILENPDKKRKDLQLDRIDNSKWYEPWNIRIVWLKEQARNKRNTIMYKWTPLIKRCEERSLPYDTIVARISRWRDKEKAINTSLHKFWMTISKIAEELWCESFQVARYHHKCSTYEELKKEIEELKKRSIEKKERVFYLKEAKKNWIDKVRYYRNIKRWMSYKKASETKLNRKKIIYKWKTTKERADELGCKYKAIHHMAKYYWTTVEEEIERRIWDGS